MNDYCNIEEDTVQLVWNDLRVEVQRKSSFLRNLRDVFGGHKDSVEILKGVSGYAETGNMIAVMGPSGAGKTTFLAALARKITLTSGSVKMNGREATSEIMSGISSYMPQFEALPPTITPREYMLFTCALKLRKSTSAQGKFLSGKLLRELGLSDCQDTFVRNLSGGQRKRLSLATELVTRPKILFLDEPTTGLDTFAAINVVQSLKLVAGRGTIVLCTIHQPGMTIYNLFSHTILMTNGKTAFHGAAESASKFFAGQGFYCPAGFDESEYHVNILSNHNPENASEKLCEAFSQSEFSKISAISACGTSEVIPFRKSNWTSQFYWLSWRLMLQKRRSVFANHILWGSYLLSVFSIATFYAQIDVKTQAGIQNARGALYLMTSEIIFTVSYAVVCEFPSELSVYLRESTMYDSGPYYITTVLGLVMKNIKGILYIKADFITVFCHIVEFVYQSHRPIPRTLLKTLIFTTVMYLILNPEIRLASFLLYYLCTTVAAIGGSAYGIAISSWILDIEVATTVMVPIDTLYLLTAGIFQNLRTLPAYLACFKYVSIFYYANEALAIVYWSQIDTIECQQNTDLPCLSSGAQVLSEYGFDPSNFWWDIINLLLLTIFLNAIGYIGVRRRRLTKALY